MDYSRFSVALSPSEQRLAWRLLLIFCLLYIYELANFNLSIDDEVIAVSPYICHFADIGRWVHPLLRATLWRQVVVPGAPLLLFGCAFAVSFIYVARLLGIAGFGAIDYAAFAAYAVFPAWYAQLEFASNVLPVALGVFAASYAALLTVDASDCAMRWRGWRMAGAVIGCSVAFGAYQTLGLMYLALVAGAGFMVCIEQPQPAWGRFVRTVARAVLVLAAGLALSLVIARLVMKACGVGPSPYGISALLFNQALSHPLDALNLGIDELRRVYFGFWRSIGRQPALIYSATVLFCCGAVVVSAARGMRWRRACGALLALLVLLLIPEGLSIVGASAMPARTFFAGAAVLLCLLLMAYRQCRATWPRRVVLVLAVLCAVQGLYVNSVQQARGWSVARRDLLLAAEIHAEIMRVHGADDRGPIYVSMRGARKFNSIYPGVKTATTGESFFEWDGGSAWRIAAYMNLIGYDEIRMFPGEPPGTVDHALDHEYAQMPVWPAPGSVRRSGNVYLVKLSGPPVPAKPPER